METVSWILICACLIHSGMFSGLNLACFGVGRLQLEIEAEDGNRAATTILALRKDSNFLLATILWGNVSVNTLLALLTESIMTGATAFVVSTFGITFLGEIIPQGYFSRHALRMGSLLAPMIRFYQFALYPVAKPSGMLLDAWLGSEGIAYYQETQLRTVIERHMTAKEADLQPHEGQGALNYLTLDDLAIGEEGEPIDPDSVINLPVTLDLPVIPQFERSADDPFLRAVHASGRKWVVLTGPDQDPLLVIDSDALLRGVLFEKDRFDPYSACHRPIVVRDPSTPIGRLLPQLRVQPRNSEDDVIDQDLIILWGDQKRIVTGADLFGRLMRGIAGTTGNPRVKK